MMLITVLLVLLKERTCATGVVEMWGVCGLWL